MWHLEGATLPLARTHSRAEPSSMKRTIAARRLTSRASRPRREDRRRSSCQDARAGRRARSARSSSTPTSRSARTSRSGRICSRAGPRCSGCSRRSTCACSRIAGCSRPGACSIPRRSSSSRSSRRTSARRRSCAGCYRDLGVARGVACPSCSAPQPAEVALPSDELSRALIAFWRHRDADTGVQWSFAEEHFDGELMGDLYQELDPVVKDRFALCQTPDFVRDFILDSTLTPAIEDVRRRSGARCSIPRAARATSCIDALEAAGRGDRAQAPGLVAAARGRRARARSRRRHRPQRLRLRARARAPDHDRRRAGRRDEPRRGRAASTRTCTGPTGSSRSSATRSSSRSSSISSG